MLCNCGGSTEYEHKVVRSGEVVAKYQKCPSCGRILKTWGEFPDDLTDTSRAQ